MKKVNWKKTEKKYAGRLCAGGIDLAKIRDMSVWVLAFPGLDDPIQVDLLLRCWVPEDTVYDKKNKYSKQYQGWISQGFMEATPGNTTDYPTMRRQIIKDFETYEINSVNVDAKFQGYGLVGDLMSDLMDDRDKPEIIIPFSMSSSRSSAVCEEFMKRLRDNKLNHGNNPVLRFHADNVAIREVGTAGNIVPDKASSQGKIDGIIGILLALDRLMRLELETEEEMPLFI